MTATSMIYEAAPLMPEEVQLRIDEYIPLSDAEFAGLDAVSLSLYLLHYEQLEVLNSAFELNHATLAAAIHIGLLTPGKDGLINCSCGVDLSPPNVWRLAVKSPKLDRLPYRFGRVGGDFECNHNELNSLDGSPRTVGKNFTCAFNKLASLQGGPTTVGQDFYCHCNQLTSLEGAPTSVGRAFNCGDNKLSSLRYAPKSVGGYFFASRNSEKFYSLPDGCKVVGDFDG